ncbi:Transcription antitermination factor NusG [Mucilaginibacter xinganensis]|uniref:Transcription antitermination factor NusG n=2 Tax=Mucilaginibacter xinganensis TaxID=1234841 RepID=A0A223NY44_9SPHI|nr:Transcription antitermination factor NusG [Mucilaginibacter xinganensis]
MESKSAASFLHEKKWLLIYTRPKWEKKVDQLLKQQGIESYCPLRTVQNQWADRKKLVSLPVFNSYVFVRVTPREECEVLYTLGVIKFVYYMGKPAVIRDHIIEQIKINLTLYQNVEVVNLQSINIGDRVKIKQGVFINQSGQVIQIMGKKILMVFDQIDCALVTCIPFGHVVLNNIKNENEITSGNV